MIEQDASPVRKPDHVRMPQLVKVGLYLLSLWLLFILILVSKVNIDLCLDCPWANRSELWNIAKENFLPGLCLVMLTVGGLVYWYFFRLIQEAKEGPKKIVEVENKNSEHLVFLATYVIPLVGFGLDGTRQIISLTITLVAIGAIYIKTDLFYANPTLSLLRFKVYNAKIDNQPVILISREELETNDAVNTIRLDKKIFFAKKAIRLS